MKSSRCFLNISTQKLWTRRYQGCVSRWTWQCVRISHTVIITVLKTWRGHGEQWGLDSVWQVWKWGQKRPLVKIHHVSYSGNFLMLEMLGLWDDHNNKCGVELVWACETSCMCCWEQNWRNGTAFGVRRSISESQMPDTNLSSPSDFGFALIWLWLCPRSFS